MSYVLVMGNVLDSIRDTHEVCLCIRMCGHVYVAFVCLHVCLYIHCYTISKAQPQDISTFIHTCMHAYIQRYDLKSSTLGRLATLEQTYYIHTYRDTISKAQPQDIQKFIHATPEHTYIHTHIHTHTYRDTIRKAQPLGV